MGKNDTAFQNVEQDVQADAQRRPTSPFHTPVAEKRRGEGLTAGGVITPATLFVACRWRRWSSCSATA